MIGSGTFVSVMPSKSFRGMVEKRFKFPVLEERALRLERAHKTYVNLIKRAITVPFTSMRPERIAGGKCQITIIQDDLRGNGRLLADVMRSKGSKAGRVDAFRKALNESLKVYMYSNMVSGAGLRLGLESNPNNWWVRQDGRMVFLDTMPPLVSERGRVETDLLVMPDNPTLVGRLSAFLSTFRLTRELSARMARKYAFDWPTSVRTFLVKAMDCAPDIAKELAAAARRDVSPLGKSFTSKLSWLSISAERLKLRIYNLLAAQGGIRKGY